MSTPKGGRGKQAPYKTIQVRCPEPVKPRVQEIIRQFHEQETENLNTGITAAQEAKVVELEASLTVLRNSVEPLKRENERLREQIREYRAKLEDKPVPQPNEPSIDPATLFNQLRPLLNRLSDRERRAIQQKLEEIVD